jgi:hypothetical protein
MRPTAALLARVATNGLVPSVTAADRAHARADLSYWGTRCVVLDPGTGQAGPLRDTLDKLFGPGRRVDGVWLWRTDTVR